MPAAQDVFEFLKDLVLNITDAEGEQILPSTRVEDLGLESMDLVELQLTVRKKFGVEVAARLDDLVAMRQSVEAIRLSSDIVDYIVDIVRATRENPALQFGASPRAANMLASAARAFAGLGGRDYVIPDDVKLLAPPTLRHRLVLAPGAEIEGLDTDKVVAQILEQVPAPR